MKLKLKMQRKLEQLLVLKNAKKEEDHEKLKLNKLLSIMEMFFVVIKVK